MYITRGELGGVSCCCCGKELETLLLQLGTKHQTAAEECIRYSLIIQNWTGSKMLNVLSIIFSFSQQTFKSWNVMYINRNWVSWLPWSHATQCHQIFLFSLIWCRHQGAKYLHCEFCFFVRGMNCINTGLYSFFFPPCLSANCHHLTLPLQKLQKPWHPKYLLTLRHSRLAQDEKRQSRQLRRDIIASSWMEGCYSCEGHLPSSWPVWLLGCLSNMCTSLNQWQSGRHDANGSARASAGTAGSDMW